jgi:hypothetical protein
MITWSKAEMSFPWSEVAAIYRQEYIQEKLDRASWEMDIRFVDTKYHPDVRYQILIKQIQRARAEEGRIDFYSSEPRKNMNLLGQEFRLMRKKFIKDDPELRHNSDAIHEYFKLVIQNRAYKQVASFQATPNVLKRTLIIDAQNRFYLMLHTLDLKIVCIETLVSADQFQRLLNT